MYVLYIIFLGGLTMGILGSIMGNASQITVDEILGKYGQLF